MIEFSIPSVPTPLNVLLRKHWSVRSREASKWRYLVLAHAPKQRAPIQNAVVTLTFVMPRGDADGRAKLPLDGLVSAGIIVDDGPKHLVELRLRAERGKPAQTRVRVEKA